MASEEEFLQVFELLSVAYPHFSPVTGDEARGRPGTIDAYREALADLPFFLLRAAAVKCLADCKFFPTVAELRTAAASITAFSQRSGVEAWGDVMAKVREHGYLRQPKFADDQVAAVVRALGWEEICMSEEPMVMRAHFIKAYEQVQQRERENARQLPVVMEVRARLAAARTDNERQIQALLEATQEIRKQMAVTDFTESHHKEA